MKTTCDLMDCDKAATVTIDVQNFGDLYWMRHRSCDEHVEEFTAEFKRRFTEVEVRD